MSNDGFSDVNQKENKDYDADVIIVGAGPVGLTIANYLGKAGISVLILEKLDTLIDFPRAIGLDDEALRVFQAIGLADEIVPHTTPFHIMRFTTPKGRCLASIDPRTEEFGWPRRNAFIQPQTDRVLYEGLKRFPSVSVLFSCELTKFSQFDSGVSVTFTREGNEEKSVSARYMVACDGGHSFIRRSLDVPFDGKTAPNQWIVIDIENDPLGVPHVDMCCDPERPYVSAALPHGIRRFEFMVMQGETEEELSKPENMRKLLGKVLPEPDNVDLIRQRVYTHNARLAAQFRIGNILLAGDAAHIMPVWQGQGYNSGIRDAANLAWKLEKVVKSLSGQELLDTYDVERRSHSRAMIDLSVQAGHVLAPPVRWLGFLRDVFFRVVDFLPPVKRYFVEMRFKPMPKYTEGVVVPFDSSHAGSNIKNNPVGQMFIQPKVMTEGGKLMLFDDVVGVNFAIVSWGTNPKYSLSEEQIAFWRGLGVVFIHAVPDVQLDSHSDQVAGVIRVGDIQGALRAWFANYSASVVVVRPDRFIAGLGIPQTLPNILNELEGALCPGKMKNMIVQNENNKKIDEAVYV